MLYMVVAIILTILFLYLLVGLIQCHCIGCGMSIFLLLCLFILGFVWIEALDYIKFIPKKVSYDFIFENLANAIIVYFFVISIFIIDSFSKDLKYREHNIRGHCRHKRDHS